MTPKEHIINRLENRNNHCKLLISAFENDYNEDIFKKLVFNGFGYFDPDHFCFVSHLYKIQIYFFEVIIYRLYESKGMNFLYENSNLAEVVKFLRTLN